MLRRRFVSSLALAPLGLLGLNKRLEGEGKTGGMVTDWGGRTRGIDRMTDEDFFPWLRPEGSLNILWRDFGPVCIYRYINCYKGVFDWWFCVRLEMSFFLRSSNKWILLRVPFGTVDDPMAIGIGRLFSGCSGGNDRAELSMSEKDLTFKMNRVEFCKDLQSTHSGEFEMIFMPLHWEK